MTKEMLAELLNGREIGDEITPDEELIAKENNLVVVFGASDDLMEFRGALFEETYASNGGDAFIIKTKSGWRILEEGAFKQAKELLDEFGASLDYEQVRAHWAPTEPNCSWLITASIPHQPFDIMEDGELFCRGAVFSLNHVGFLKTMSGLELIAKERQRQIEVKGYDQDHDEMETAFQLSGAAAMFIANAMNKDFEDHSHYDDMGNCARFQVREIDTENWKEHWPWDDHDGREKADVMTSLIKAGALIAAEIDRLQNQ